jgi:hypothetical protein
MPFGLFWLRFAPRSCQSLKTSWSPCVPCGRTCTSTLTGSRLSADSWPVRAVVTPGSRFGVDLHGGAVLHCEVRQQHTDSPPTRGNRFGARPSPAGLVTCRGYHLLDLSLAGIEAERIRHRADSSPAQPDGCRGSPPTGRPVRRGRRPSGCRGLGLQAPPPVPPPSRNQYADSHS